MTLLCLCYIFSPPLTYVCACLVDVSQTNSDSGSIFTIVANLQFESGYFLLFSRMDSLKYSTDFALYFYDASGLEVKKGIKIDAAEPQTLSS